MKDYWYRLFKNVIYMTRIILLLLPVFKQVKLYILRRIRSLKVEETVLMLWKFLMWTRKIPDVGICFT